MMLDLFGSAPDYINYLIVCIGSTVEPLRLHFEPQKYSTVNFHNLVLKSGSMLILYRMHVVQCQFNVGFRQHNGAALCNGDMQKVTHRKHNTRNKSITSKAMQYRQDIVTRMPMRVELVTISIVTIRGIWHKLRPILLLLGKFTPQICESCGATYRQNYKTFSVL